MRKIAFYFSFLLLASCSFLGNEERIYKNLYITNGGEFSDYQVVAIKLKNGDQINIFPFEVKDYKIESTHIIFKCIDFYGDEKFYLMEKKFDEYNFEKKITGPLNKKELEILAKKNKFNIQW